MKSVTALDIDTLGLCEKIGLKLGSGKCPRLTWLPKNPDWRDALTALDKSGAPWSSLRALANSEIDFVETARLDRRLSKLPLHGRPEQVRLGLLSSCTVDQLLPSIRVAALRRNISLDIHMPDCGQFRQALLDPHSSFAAFRPHVVLFAIDARTFVGTELIVDPEAAEAHLSDRLNDLVTLWRIAREKFGAQVIQQTFLPTFTQVSAFVLLQAKTMEMK